MDRTGAELLQSRRADETAPEGQPLPMVIYWR
jgi:hypothetical protein